MPINSNNKEEKVFSISEYIGLVNFGLKNYRAKIIGEISESKIGSKGHVYFTLKDEKDGSIISCAMWKFRYDVFNIELKTGLKVIALGCPNIHSQYGFSFIVESIEIAGEGALKKEYERLKKKLTEEGAFIDSRKKSIPKYPQRIGVITSMRSGVVIADFSNNLDKVGFKVKIVDSRVEGQEAVMDLLSSVKFFRKQDIEVLIIMRGGGSFEAMTAFNNEMLVREVINFPVPVIAAIGHHKDMPLVALGADLAVSTPTAAASCLNESWREAGYLLERFERFIMNQYRAILHTANLLIARLSEIIKDERNRILEQYKIVENKLRISLQNFKNSLSNISFNIKNSTDKLFIGFKSVLSLAKQQEGFKVPFSTFKNTLFTTEKNLQNYSRSYINNFNHYFSSVSQELLKYEENIRSNNPETQLNLGYSIATIGGKLVRDASSVKVGQNMDIKVVGGIIVSEVKNINLINRK